MIMCLILVFPIFLFHIPHLLMFFILVHVAVITACRVHRQWHLYNITLLQTTGVLHIASSYSLHSY